jgi:hypothetical protein
MPTKTKAVVSGIDICLYIGAAMLFVVGISQFSLAFGGGGEAYAGFALAPLAVIGFFMVLGALVAGSLQKPVPSSSIRTRRLAVAFLSFALLFIPMLLPN